ncbi:protein-export membrane protein SecF [Thioploca ingrica]|uniref:Protein-export membrane protein SecF n=1 Tax=Thioploca ingrica TaxID=40754 RepID=A0A090AKF6_9GAMM|nr:protein-export membrane protein SecF [Thioploca ingrica]
MLLTRFDYKYNFMGIRHIAMAFSVVLITVSIISFFVRGLAFGLDFTGGTLIEVGYKQPVQLEKIRTNLHNNGFADAVLQYFGTDRDVIIRLGQHEESKDNRLSTQILKILQTDGEALEMRRVEYVGPQVGNELIEKGVLAVIYTLIGILIYVALRFEYRLATGAIVALLHDPILIVGLFSLFQLEFDLTVLAAILAVIGYSINDTIVVYDRIRDNLIKMRKQSVIDVMNTSINQTLSRTVMTSTTTLLVVVVLFFVGGELIHGFALALIAGIVVGTYSSIYVASALALELGVSRENLMPVPKEGANIKTP